MEDIDEINHEININQQLLNYDQICRLDDVLNVTLTICGECGLPTLSITIKDFLLTLRQRMEFLDFPFLDIRLNGGAAAYVLDKNKGDRTYHYSDVDILINVRQDTLPYSSGYYSSSSSFESSQHSDYISTSHYSLNKTYNNNDDSIFNSAISCVLSTISQLLPTNYTTSSIPIKSYLQNLVRISNPDLPNGDSWSLISLGGPLQPRLDLKFSQRLQRKFEFSIDSFQIPLDGLLNFCEAAHSNDSNETNLLLLTSNFISSHFYPTVHVISYWDNVEDALNHLYDKKIYTVKPEQLRGGGLLKYCKLLVHKFTVPTNCDIVLLEKYMCSRFFIDYKDINSQSKTIYNYVQNHFHGPDAITFLHLLYKVISLGSVCLMNHERKQTLTLINNFIQIQTQQLINKNYITSYQYHKPITKSTINNNISILSINNRHEISLDNFSLSFDGIITSSVSPSSSSAASVSSISSTPSIYPYHNQYLYSPISTSSINTPSIDYESNSNID